MLHPVLSAAGRCLLLVLACCLPVHAQTGDRTAATAVPLLLPTGLAYDTTGNLYVAEAGKHLIRRITPAGLITTVAGSGAQGFGGDGGPARAALLDTPVALALDAVGTIYVADSHNGCVRRIDGSGTIATYVTSRMPVALALDAVGDLYIADAAAHRVLRVDKTTGTIANVAGNGVQGFAGDGGPALLASIDTPSGLAFDTAGNLLLTDAHNHRIRRVDHITGTIDTLAAALGLPKGLTADAAGNIFVADASGQRVLRIDAATGAIAILAGRGIQGFAGDESPAIAAEVDAPAAVTLAPGGLATFADRANGRVRQVDAGGILHTIAGLGVTGSAGVLTLKASTVIVYGTGSVQALLTTSAATGSVTLFDGTDPANPHALATMTLLGNAATFDLASLNAGTHRLSATYAGDAAHGPAQSELLSLTVAPAALAATPAGISLLYGQALPTLTGSLQGLLVRDAGAVSASFSSAATTLSPPGAYPIVATLAGPAAGNYMLTTSPAAVVIAKAPARATLSSGLVAHLATTTTGVPTGAVSLIDGSAPVATAALNAAGDAVFAASALSTGSHTLTAAYAGDLDFLPASSAPTFVSVGGGPSADFTLASSSPNAVTIPAGTAAQFGFAMTPVNGALASPVALSVAGLPPGATATFNPASLPPASSPAAVVLTIATIHASLWHPGLVTLAVLLPLVLLHGRRGRRWGLIGLALLAVGCGDRVNGTGQGTALRSYTIVVTGTATANGGGVITHSVAVTLNLQ